MRPNPVKLALKAGSPQVGSWLSLCNQFSARLMARMGFAWLTVDIEHSPVNWETAAHLFGAIADAGCIPLARVPRGDHDLIKRALDGGAHGIVVPMVNTVEEAKAAIAAAKYPPFGNRSVGGSLHALNFGVSAGEYFQHANDQILVVLQTESPEGVRNAREIYSLPGVDAIFVGPNDLQAQMRSPDGKNPTPEEFEAMLAQILATGRACGTPVGIHVQTPADCRMRIEQGWRFMALASDLAYLVNGAKNALGELKLATSGDLARY